MTEPVVARRRLSGLSLGRVGAWKDSVAVIVSVSALAVSILGWVAANRPADVKLVFASKVHLSAGSTARVYLQPVFVSTAANDRAEVIDTVTATIAVSGAPGIHDLTWTQTGVWDIGPFPDYTVSWGITSLNPEPILITPARPQTAILQFNAAPGFAWVPGTYRIDVRAHRLVSTDPLNGALEFELSADQVAEMVRQGDRRFMSFDARTIP